MNKPLLVYDKLPEGYQEIRLYSIRDRSFRLITGPVSFLISLAAAFLIYCLKTRFHLNSFVFEWHWIYLLDLALLLAAYTAAHEITHGIVYKLISPRKLKFGIRGSLAYCGLPGVYMEKRAAYLSLLAPFVLYSILFLFLLWLVPLNTFWMILLLAFMNHLGGCSADLYAAYRIAAAPEDLLIMDAGDEQHFYVPHP